MKRILIFLEQEHLQACLDLIQAANLIGRYWGEYQIYGVGLNLSQVEVEADVDVLIDIQAIVERFDAKQQAQLLAEVFEGYRFDCLLICATPFGRMLAPRLAMKLATGLVADVTDLQEHGDQLMMIRPAFSGKMMAGIISEKSPLMMSIRPNVFKAPLERRCKTEWIAYEPKCVVHASLRLLKEEELAETLDIRNSTVLVSCGGGMVKHLELAEQLAKCLGGKLAVSRRPVDMGVVSRSIQVGQSGKIVSPAVYIALGISGAIQHIDGLKNVNTLICVNIDKYAPFNHLADIVVEGDGQVFIQKLMARISQG